MVLYAAAGHPKFLQTAKQMMMKLILQSKVKLR